MSGKADIFTAGPNWSNNFERWELVRDLFGGQRKLRENATRWRPRGRIESGREYQELIEGASLNNGFMRTVDRVTSRVFIREVEIAGLEGSDDAKLLPLLDSIDNEGTPLTQWASDMHRTAAAYGLAHWMVEHTGPDASPGRDRPYVWSLDPLSVIDWVHDEDGRLIDLRVECERVNRGANPWDFERQKTVRRYFVDGDNVFSEVYVRDGESGEAARQGDPIPLIDSRNAPLPEIPIVVLYFNRVATFEAASPYDDLANVTLRNWLSYIEQAANLRTVRIPLLSMTGVSLGSPDDPENNGPTGDGDKVSITNRAVLHEKSPEGRFAYVETTGKALEQGWTDLNRLEEQMQQFGDQPAAGKSGHETATGVWLDDLSTQGSMARWTRADERAITETIRLMARWRGVELSEDVKAVIREERPLQPADDRKQGRLGEMFDRGVLSKKTYVDEMQRAGALSEAVDPEVEVAVASSEAAEASTMLAQLDGAQDFGAGVFDQNQDVTNDGQRN